MENTIIDIKLARTSQEEDIINRLNELRNPPPNYYDIFKQGKIPDRKERGVWLGLAKNLYELSMVFSPFFHKIIEPCSI